MATRVMIVVEGTDLEQIDTVADLLLIKSQLRVVDDGFQELKVETPEWITDKLAEVNSEVNTRLKGELLRRLRAAKARRSALRTDTEKREELDQQIAELEGRVE